MEQVTTQKDPLTSGQMVLQQELKEVSGDQKTRLVVVEDNGTEDLFNDTIRMLKVNQSLCLWILGHREMLRESAPPEDKAFANKSYQIKFLTTILTINPMTK